VGDKAWKAFERRIAKSLGTVRTPLSGKHSRITAGDTLHTHMLVECKCTALSTTCKLFRKTRTLARAEDKIPVLALHQKRFPGAVAVVDWDFFLKLMHAYEIHQNYLEDQVYDDPYL